MMQRKDGVGELLFWDAKRRQESRRVRQVQKEYEEVKDVGKGSFMLKNSH